MEAKSRRVIGLILIGASTILLYMEALKDIRTWNLLEDSMLHSGPLDMWARFPEGLDDETRSVFSLLSDNQNPEDCSKRKYFLWAPLNWGIGSDIHTIGIALGFAMHHNRTLVYHPSSDWIYTSPDICYDKPTPDCFFRPLSSCQWLVDAQAGQSFTTFDMVSKKWESQQFVFLNLDNEEKLLVKERNFIPHILDWPTRTVSWWRSQTTRYIVRPLPSLLAWTKTYLDESLRRYPWYPALKGWSPRIQSPPGHAICIHVRHGDKVAEMTLHPMENYLAAASDAALHMDAPTDIFLSTDDRDLIENIEQGYYDHYGFTYYYTSYDRPTEAISPMATANLIGRGHFGRISLANLVLGVHPFCEAFVQTTGSNWNRLINEIRKTDGMRHDALWIDLEPGEWRR